MQAADDQLFFAMNFDFMEDLLSGNLDPADFDPRQKQCRENQNSVGLPRAQRIALHNADAEKQMSATKLSHTEMKAASYSYESKQTLSTQSLADLVSMPIKSLKRGLVHQGKVVYCTVVAKPTLMKSVQTLVEDADGNMTALAVYNVPRVRDIFQAQRYLHEGRKIAVKEPFYKVRADGTEGIRVDDPKDIVLDAEAPAKSLEERLREMLQEDSTTGQQSLREALRAEGFSVSAQRLRKLLTATRADCSATSAAQPRDEDVAPEHAEGRGDDFDLPDRRPEQHRNLCGAAVLKHREQGNIAVKSGDFAVAEVEYSKALACAEQEAEASIPDLSSSIALWTLYSNRSAARVRLHRPDEALVDALQAHVCSPLDAAKPYLRLAEAFYAMHRHTAACRCMALASKALPSACSEFERKIKSLQPTAILHVGVGQEFQSLCRAVLAAPADAEILVHPGVYRESLVLLKPVTIRGVGAVVPNKNWVHGAEDGAWVEIWVKDSHAIVAAVSGGTACLEGLRIICEGAFGNSFHALLVQECSAILRNCSLSGLSGPIVAADQNARLIMDDCAVHDGKQGGILACHQSALVLSNLRCCRAHHSVEIRQGSTARISSCEFFSNTSQGLFIWCGAGHAHVVNTDIHSNSFESGTMVEENPGGAYFEACRFFGNGCAGIVAQRGGQLHMKACEVFGNFGGILIQDRCSAVVENCQVHDNSDGIFVGYDHLGEVTLSHNRVFDNCTKGIILGTGRKKVKLDGNEEIRNGLAPGLRGMMPNFRQDKASLESRCQQSAMDMRRWAKNVQKSGGSVKKAAAASSEPTFFDFAASMSDDSTQKIAQQRFACGFCKILPDGRKFKVCDVCRAVSYCSRDCQTAHWKAGHKKSCKAPVLHPSLVDHSKSVADPRVVP